MATLQAQRLREEGRLPSSSQGLAAGSALVAVGVFLACIAWRSIRAGIREAGAPTPRFPCHCSACS
jgi:hypothetical protein